MADDPPTLRELLHRLRNQLNAIAVTADLLAETLAPGPHADDAAIVSTSAHEAAATATEIALIVKAMIAAK